MSDKALIDDRSMVEQLLKGVGLPSTRATFQGGRLVKLDLSGATKFDLEGLLQFDELRELSLNEVVWLKDFSFLAGAESPLPYLESLSINYLGSSAIDAGPLAQLRNLRNLWAQGTALRNLGALSPKLGKALQGRKGAEVGNNYYQGEERVMLSIHGTRLLWN